jgi:hypothetical protein
VSGKLKEKRVRAWCCAVLTGQYLDKQKRVRAWCCAVLTGQYLDKQDNNAVLAANIDFQGYELQHKIKPYVVKQVRGKKVGGSSSGLRNVLLLSLCLLPVVSGISSRWGTGVRA